MKRYVSLLVVLLVWCVAGPWSRAAAAPLEPREIPTSLREWIPWIQHDKPEVACPFINDSAGEARRCQWPARLELDLGDKGGRFSQSWRVYTKGWVPLPGDARRWPQEVTVDGASAVVVTRGDRPGVELSPGTHAITGKFMWDSTPERLEVPPETGLLTLRLAGQDVPYPQRDASGALWLNRRVEEGTEEDFLELVVNRKIQDAIPVVITTRVELNASGKNREELLAKTALQGFTPMSVTSELPARIEPDGRLRVQVRPGRWVISIDARHDGPVKELALPAAAGGPWAPEEIWAYEASPSLHEVDVSGGAPIDPQQTLLPDEWKRFPAYRLAPGEALQLIERRRGEVDRGPDRLTLRREWWLDFAGSSLTVRDRITGQVHNAWRLDMRPPGKLGRVTISGKDLPITYRDNDAYTTGVELRQRSLNLSADIRVPGDDGRGVVRISAVDWDHDFHEVDGTLHLPPGWRLLHASGVDEVDETWVQGWSLLDIFLALVISIAIGRLFGAGWTLLSLVTLGLCFPEWMAPQVIFIFVLVGEALHRALPPGTLRKLVSVYRWLTLIILAVMTTAFCVQQVNGGLYPALEKRGGELSRGLLGLAAPGVYKDDAVAQTAAAPMPENAAAADMPAPPPEPEPMVDTKPSDKKMDEREKDVRFAEDFEEVGDLLEDQTVAGKKGKRALGEVSSISRSRLALKRQQLREYDANTVVQTGPGVPSWRWRSVHLDWSGPVNRQQEITLYLLAPQINMILAFVRVVFMIALVLAVFGVFRPRRRKTKGAGAGAKPGAAAASVLLCLGAAGSLLMPAEARADQGYPSDALLQQLAERVAERPSCLPGCATSPRMELEAAGAGLRIRMEVHTAAHVAIPLPGGAAQWLPSAVVVDGDVTRPAAAAPAPASASADAPEGSGRRDRRRGREKPGADGEPASLPPLKGAPALGLARDSGGTLWLDLEPGRHQIVLDGPLPARETVQLGLPLKPHHVTARADGWTIEGIHEDGLADDNLQLTRVHKAGEEAPQTLEMGPLPPFVTVERELTLGLSWVMTTRVVRVTPTGAAVVVSVPLLPGESVTSERMRVEDGKVLVNMAPDQRVVEWSSSLQVSDAIVLKAAAAQPWVEVWRLEVGPLWHLDSDGIPIVSQGDEGQREWRPWPAEIVELKISRPEGVSGQTRTIDSADLRLSPGLRATDATLSFVIRSSRGGYHTIELPKRAQLQGVRINGQEKAIGQEERRVRIPLIPGAQNVELDWREPVKLGTRYRAPELKLALKDEGNVSVVNYKVRVYFPRDRWILWVQGPRLGPAVLFWSSLVVLLILAIVLGRLRMTPLRGHQWFLLGLGLSAIPYWVAVFVVLWLLALGWRRRVAQWKIHPALFDLIQLAMLGLSLLAVFILIVAVQQGLLGQPDMQIAGNGSYRNDLIWYQDRVGDAAPRPEVYSVSLLLFYRGAMLLWALWLAWSLVRWMPWAWRSVTAGGLWRTIEIGAPPKGGGGGPGTGGGPSGPGAGGGPGGGGGSNRMSYPPGHNQTAIGSGSHAGGSQARATAPEQATTPAAPRGRERTMTPIVGVAPVPAAPPEPEPAPPRDDELDSPASSQPRGSWDVPSSVSFERGMIEGLEDAESTAIGVTNSGSYAIAEAARAAAGSPPPKKRRILSTGPSISGSVRVSGDSEASGAGISGAGLSLAAASDPRMRRVFEPKPLLPIPDSAAQVHETDAPRAKSHNESSGAIVVPKVDTEALHGNKPLPPPPPPAVIPKRLTHSKGRK